MKKIILGIFLCILIISCSTMDPVYLKSQLKKAMLTGKVITEEGLPLEGVDVKMNDLFKTNTDINGRFLFNYIKFGKHKVIFIKNEYLTEEYKFVFNFRNRKLPFIKVKMLSTNYLVNEVFELLKEKKYKKAKEIINKLEKINKDAEVVIYLNAMFFYVQKNYKAALPILELLKERDRKNIYYQLTLVNVYEELKLYENMVKLSLYIGRNNTREYLEYIKIAYEIYRDKLNNINEYEKIKQEYDNLANKR